MKYGQWFLCAAVMISFTLQVGRAQDACLLTADIILDDGRPIVSTHIELTDPSGKIVLQRQTSSRLEICDFGFGPHTLRVGTNERYPVTISSLIANPSYPIRLKIILNSGPQASSGSNFCEVYFRVFDEDGSPVANASVIAGNRAGSTDIYGRIISGVSRRRPVTYSVKKSGFVETTLDVECEDSEQIRRTVVLRRAQ